MLLSVIFVRTSCPDSEGSDLIRILTRTLWLKSGSVQGQVAHLVVTVKVSS